MAVGNEIMVCAEAADCSGAILAAQRTQPDVCLVGFGIPGGGLDAVRGIREVAPGTAVIVLTEMTEADGLLASVRAGAVGYISGQVNAESLGRIIDAVAANEAAVPRAMVLELLQELRAAETSTAEGLTSREVQVLGMVRGGHSTASIADRLEIAPVTVRRHISELVHKLGVPDRAALISH